jgi:hypothetical protein
MEVQPEVVMEVMVLIERDVIIAIVIVKEEVMYGM